MINVNPKQIVLVSATVLEARLLCESLFPTEVITWNQEEKFLYFTVPINNDHVVVFVVTGIGLRRAYDGLTQALSLFKNVESVIGFGLAGGLIKIARKGDLVIPKTVQTHDEKWVPLLSLKNFITSKRNEEPWNKLLSTDQIISSPIDKAGIYAASGMEAVDMESGSWAKACVESNINSWTVVRVILNGGDETFPDLMNILNNVGEVKIHRALLHFMLHPGHLSTAINMTASKLKKVVAPGAGVIQAFLASKGHQERYNNS